MSLAVPIDVVTKADRIIADRRAYQAGRDTAEDDMRAGTHGQRVVGTGPFADGYAAAFSEWQQRGATLTEQLAARGYTHRATGRGYQHEVRDAGGRVVITGTAHRVQHWVNEGCPESTGEAS